MRTPPDTRRKGDERPVAHGEEPLTWWPEHGEPFRYKPEHGEPSCRGEQFAQRLWRRWPLIYLILVATFSAGVQVYCLLKWGLL